jgi:hypothetical protein
MKLLHPFLVSIAAALACAPTANAQADEWKRTVMFYLFGAGIDGETQLGPVASEVDESFDDILENLDMGGMGSFRASNESWAHTIDAIYVGLSDDVALPLGIKVKAEIDQLIASYDIGYQLSDRFEVLLGARYNSIDLEITQLGPTSAQASGDKDWIDPYVGFNVMLPLGDKLDLALRGDVGGFDVGSKLAWQAIVRLNWNFSETFFATFGYRILDTDYEDGSGARFFKYDVTMSGPGAGIGWRF